VEVLGPGPGPGWGPGSPADVRRKIERRLFAFGATKAARTYSRPKKLDGLLEEFQAEFGDPLAGMDQKAETSPESKPGVWRRVARRSHAKPRGLSRLLSAT
jgi:hypothetical protein